MMKLRRRIPIVCDRVDRNGASRVQSNEDHKSSPSARPERRGRRYQTLPIDQAGRATHDLQHVCMYVCMYAHMYACMHACVHTYIHKYVQVRTYGYVRTYVRTYVHTCTYICTCIH